MKSCARHCSLYVHIERCCAVRRRTTCFQWTSRYAVIGTNDAVSNFKTNSVVFGSQAYRLSAKVFDDR